MSDRKFLVLGAGMMGRAIAHDLVRSRGKECLITIDANEKACDSLRGWLDIDVRHMDVNGDVCGPEIEQMMADSDVLIVALPYGFNLELMKKAIKAGCHFCDLGGNVQSHNLKAMWNYGRSRRASTEPRAGVAD